MGIIGEPWGPSGAPHVFTDVDGRAVTIQVYSHGVLLTDDGGASQLPHVEATSDPDVIQIGTERFRRIPA